ncbi:DUF2182 domain-containing protein [Saccharomonospora saliphila]|uniref:DUF2182 domain-containing protein n=1 Tax=Saccharomonospora saliphila TaxID=369829 RepID=UPI001E64F80C|nr:DUF2182 domain-containing protein [Saccharomonospora saliphila]
MASAWTRVELALAAVLLALAGVSWLVTAGVAMPDMRVGVLTGPPPDAMAMETGVGPAAFGLFLATWLVMMAAMMLPAIVPFTAGLAVLLPDGARSRSRLLPLTAGYLLVWGLAGVLAFLLLRGFETATVSGTPQAVRVGAVVLLVAGAFQFTPLKRWCLVRCRSPLALVMRHGDRAASSHLGALLVGTRHGGYCLGCCWALMAVLLAVGVMNLAWMALVAAVITVEKVLPRGELLSLLLGGALVSAGAVLLAVPGLLIPA